MKNVFFKSMILLSCLSTTSIAGTCETTKKAASGFTRNQTNSGSIVMPWVVNKEKVEVFTIDECLSIATEKVGTPLFEDNNLTTTKVKYKFTDMDFSYTGTVKRAN